MRIDPMSAATPLISPVLASVVGLLVISAVVVVVVVAVAKYCYRRRRRSKVTRFGEHRDRGREGEFIFYNHGRLASP